MLLKETVLSGAEHPGTKIKVLHSPAGYYLGFLDVNGVPFSRETLYMTKRQAEEMIAQLRD